MAATLTSTILGYLDGTNLKVVHTTASALGPATTTALEDISLPHTYIAAAYLNPRNDGGVATSASLLRFDYEVMNTPTSGTILQYRAKRMLLTQATDANRDWAAALSAECVGVTLDIISFGT